METIKIILARLTKSRVAWMAIPAGIAMIVKPFIAADISPQLDAVFGGIWMILAVFLAVNDPTDQNHL